MKRPTKYVERCSSANVLTVVRILLDSNIWRYIVDADALVGVQKAVRASRNTIVVAPAVLYEAAHTADKRLRDELLAAMARVAWKRLMPEAYSEAEEFKAEVRRLRPEWLRRQPDLVRFKRIRFDWVRSRGGVWDHIRAEAELLQRHDAEMNQRTREQADALHDQARSWSPKWRSATLAKTMAIPPSPLPGWNGHPVEAWRIESLAAFTASVGLPGHPTIDWIEGEVDIDRVLYQSESLVKFWLHDVVAERMPRHWLRWAFTFLQRVHRVTEGTPADAQLGTYLLDVDLMLSADKILETPTGGPLRAPQQPLSIPAHSTFLSVRTGRGP